MGAWDVFYCEDGMNIIILTWVFKLNTKVFEKYDKCGKQGVLRLKKTPYELCQSPRDFWKYLNQKLIASGMIQPNIDPCIFIRDKVI